MGTKALEYRDYTGPELEEKLRQFEEELFNLKFQAKTSKLDKPHKIRLIRRDIARLKTFLRQIDLKDSAKLKSKLVGSDNRKQDKDKER